MQDLTELEKLYNEAKKNKDWKEMAAIMLKVYPEHQQQNNETSKKNHNK
jgi:hypothetical protein